MRVTGGEALAHQLVREGITDVFGVPGVQLDWAVDGLRQVRDRIRFIVTRHEQATSYMADGYARTTGRIGTCMVVPGPGLLNAMSGLATAYACSSRVLCVAGNIFSGGLGKGHGLLHEVNGQSCILGAVTKWHGSAASPQEIPAVVREAVGHLTSSRPRPVGIEIPHDVLSASGDVDTIDPTCDPDGRVRPDPRQVAIAAEMLSGARFPVIYAGGGILAARASDALARVADGLQAPVVMSDHGRGGLPDSHPLALNTLGGRAVFPHADVVLVAGSRFIEFNQGTPAWPADGKRYIFLNVEPVDWSPPRSCAHAILADAALGLDALAAELSIRRPSRAQDVAKARAWVLEQASGAGPLMAWTHALRAAIPHEGIFVMDLTQVGYFARLMYPVYEPYTFLTPGYQGTLGYGFAAALGAAAGNPGRPVVCVTGDGGFGWTMPELSTARKYDLAVTTVVFNDGHYGNVRTMLTEQFGESYGADLVNPRYDRLAEAFDLPFAQVDTPAALERALRDAIAGGGPALIEVRLGPLPNPWHLFRLRAPFGKGNHAAPPNPLGLPEQSWQGGPVWRRPSGPPDTPGAR
jgi:acetolactate synthase-1/2/3 large subunit